MCLCGGPGRQLGILVPQNCTPPPVKETHSWSLRAGLSGREKAPQQAADHQALDRATDRKSSDPRPLQGPREQTVCLQLYKKTLKISSLSLCRWHGVIFHWWNVWRYKRRPLGAESLWPTQQVCLKPENNQLDSTKDYDETQINKWPTNPKQCTTLVRNAQCFSILGYSSSKILDFWTLHVLILLL